MTKPSNTAAIEAKTGMDWDAWTTLLDASGAQDLSHGDIAELVRLELEGKIDSPGWWSQSVAVAYEQHIGRRSPGQRGNGTFEISVTRTLPESREAAFARVLAAVAGRTEFDGAQPDNVRTSSTLIRSYWRCHLSDGTEVTIAAEERVADRTVLTITHSRLPASDEQQRWRTYWKNFISTV